MDTTNEDTRLLVEDEEKSMSYQSTLNNKGNAVMIGTRLRVDQIPIIDSKAQQYQIRGILGLDWIASDIDKQRFAKNPKKFEPSEDYVIHLQNAVDVNIETTEYTLMEGSGVYAEPGRKYVYKQLSFLATFSDEFELYNYPFDVQGLTIAFYTDHTIAQLLFEPCHCWLEAFSLDQTYLSISDWDVVSIGVFYTHEDWTAAKMGGAMGRRDREARSSAEPAEDKLYASTYYRLQLKRDSFTVLFKVMLWMFILACMAFFQFSMVATNVSARLTYSIGLLFAVIAFQFVISSVLPAIPYFTLVDKYNLLVLVLVMICALESVVVGWKTSARFAWLDLYFLGGIAIVTFVLHTAFAWMAYSGYKIETWKIGKTREEISQYLSDLRGNYADSTVLRVNALLVSTILSKDEQNRNENVKLVKVN